MSKPSAKKSKSPPSKPAKAPRGRTAQTTKSLDPNPTGRISPIETQTQTNRAIGRGGGALHRGDRRDMHPLFSTGKNKSQGGKRGPIGRSTRKGGAND
jgi:hypothetical protein